MKLTDIAYMLETPLEIKFSTVTGKWYADFTRLEIKANGFLLSCGGEHENNSSAALRSLADNIRGKTLVKNAHSKDKRTEYKIPDEEIII